MSFRDGLTAVVVGASGGIGAAVRSLLERNPRVRRIYGTSRSPVARNTGKVISLTLDLEDEPLIERLAEQIRGDGVEPDLIFVASGILHREPSIKPEKSWRSIDAEAMAAVLRINTIGPALIGKHLLPTMPKAGKSVFAAVSARVGSIGDNRLGGWYAYRASKAALNMILRGFSIELARKSPDAVCIGLHPGTVDTGLSKPFQANVPEGRLLTPAQSAACLLDVVNAVTPADSGGVFSWDGRRIPE
ncbi:SDR family NAD(P)-dependent oxidoreductase [Nisaea sp.]|uniref:SDR family NAD(P)-dependent oxidoreductase n=1 Tax=Nisaea sp. TaxID=2024842 RepID=UPI003B51E249